MLKLQFQFGIVFFGESHARLKMRLLIIEMFDFGDYKLRDVKIDHCHGRYQRTDLLL